MLYKVIALLAVGAVIPRALALTSGSWTMTAYADNDCQGDVIGSMAGDFALDDGSKDNIPGNDGHNANGCLQTTDSRPANSIFMDFIDTENNGSGNTYVSLDNSQVCSGPGTYYDGAHPGLLRNSCQFVSAPGCIGISKYQATTILYSGDDTTCLGIA